MEILQCSPCWGHSRSSCTWVNTQELWEEFELPLTLTSTLRLEEKKSLSSQTEARGVRAQGPSIEVRVWPPWAPSPLDEAPLPVVVLCQTPGSWPPRRGCCFCLRCLSKGCWTSCKHLPLPRLRGPSKRSRSVVGDHLWSLPHFSSTLTFCDVTEIRQWEFSAGGAALFASLSFYTSGCSAFKMFSKNIFWKPYIMVHKLSFAD